MIVPAVDATPSAATGLSGFDNSFVRDLDGLYQPWTATQASDPVLLALNVGLAHELGADSEVLRSPVGVAALVGNTVPDGAEPVAQAYAGHQFGGFSPRLGDGRALLLGEIIGIDGRRRDVHLKGSGRTPFARGGDGLASVGPMLREYLMCEAMHALGVPTTRALSVVATGDRVMRETPLPGAVFARVASSHLRVGTFQFAATSDEPSLLNRLADHAIARHHPGVADDGNRYVAFFDAVMDAQASLVAQWMLVGFVHGVMNTDNTTISGETIDYGPCAFLDAYDPATVFSSIDHGGRYAYGNQPGIVQWNLARLAETLLPLFGHDTDDAVAVATERLNTFPDRYRNRWRTGMWAKLGFVAPPSDDALVDDLLSLLEADRVDFTSFFRNLSEAMRDDEAPVRQLFTDPAGYDAWSPRWREAQAADDRPRSRIADEMDRVNPLYVPRNHLVEEALAAAVDGDTIGDLAPFERLIEVLTDPFTARPGLERYARPAPGGFTDGYRTFCGT